MLSKTIELCNLRITNAILGIAHVIDDNIMTGMTQQYISPNYLYLHLRAEGGKKEKL